MREPERRKRYNENRNRKIRTDSEWRERVLERERARRRKKYAEDSEYREACKRAYRDRYANDEAFRARTLERHRNYYRDEASTPEGRDEIRERNRFAAYAQRRRKGAAERVWAAKSGRGSPVNTKRESVDARPFLAWLDSKLSTVSLKSLCDAAGMHERGTRRIREMGRCTIATVARFVEGAGEPEQLLLLYPVDGAPLIPSPRGKPTRVRSYCASMDCHEPNGHGDRGNFCLSHGFNLDRIRLEFEAEEMTGRWALRNTDLDEFGEAA